MGQHKKPKERSSQHFGKFQTRCLGRSLSELSQRFLAWVDDARVEDKTRTYYHNGWRLLKAAPVVNMRLDEITSDCVDRLNFAARLRTPIALYEH